MDISQELSKLKKRYGSVYAPVKYFQGLKTPQEVKTRYLRILRGSKTSPDDPKAYRPFKTDRKVTVRPSKYTLAFMKKYPNADSLREKAEVTGVPLDIIQKVYDKGLAAWRTGHRPGASQQAWGYARVHSFLMKGCTFYTADKSLVSEAKERMNTRDYNRWMRLKKMC